MSPTIETDDYGSVTADHYRFLKQSNVSPMDYNEIVAYHSADEKDVQSFVTAHSGSGSYRAPWPFPGV